MRVWARTDLPSGRNQTRVVQLVLDRDLKGGKLDLIELTYDEVVKLVTELLIAARAAR